DDLLHRSRAGILFSPGGRWRNLRVFAGLAAAPPKPALRALSKCLVIPPLTDALLSIQPALASFHSLVTRLRLARSSRPPAARTAFSHQSSAGGAKSFHHACADECVSELPLSLRRETRLWPDNHLREPPRRKDVRTLRLQGFEPGRNHQIQSV